MIPMIVKRKKGRKCGDKSVKVTLFRCPDRSVGFNFFRVRQTGHGNGLYLLLGWKSQRPDEQVETGAFGEDFKENFMIKEGKWLFQKSISLRANHGCLCDCEELDDRI